MQHQKIRSLLQNNREAFFRGLYERSFPLVAKMIQRTGGNLNDAQDVFQDAMVVFYEKVKEEQLELKNTPNAYVLGIAKHLWYQKAKRSTGILPFTELEQNLRIEPDYFKGDREIARNGRLLRFLEKAGQKCLDLLQAFYYQKNPLEEIKERFGYSSVRSATVQKYKCLEKIRKQVKNKSYAEIFEGNTAN